MENCLVTGDRTKVKNWKSENSDTGPLWSTAH